METDRVLAAKYLPGLMLDRREPFSIGAVGYTVFRETKRSDSFPGRIIRTDWDKIRYVIEYAVWFDYDIQHLYELEHVWVYVDHRGEAVWAEGSFHGKYLNQVRLADGAPALDAEGRITVWMQPGKHAVLPDPSLVRLVPEWRESCSVHAGADGLAVPEAFRGRIPRPDEAVQERICSYIRKKYAFEPSMEFIRAEIEEGCLMPWEKLKESIPGRLELELEKMGVLELLQRNAEGRDRNGGGNPHMQEWKVGQEPYKPEAAGRPYR